MRLVIAITCVAAVAGLLYVALTAWLESRARRRGPWRVETVTRADGTYAVIVLREGSEHARTVCELAPGLDSVELASELRLAREDAQLQADELNRAT